MEESRLVSEIIKNQIKHIYFDRIVKLKSQFISNPTFQNFKLMHKFASKMCSHFEIPKCKINKHIRITLTDDNCNIIYNNNIKIFGKKIIDENHGMNNEQVFKMFQRVVSKYFNKLISEKYRSNHDFLMLNKKPNTWVHFTDGNWNYFSSFTPGTISVGVTDTITFNATSNIIYSTYSNNGYSGVVINSTCESTSETITFTSIPSSTQISFLSVGGGGGGGESCGGGGGGITYTQNLPSEYFPVGSELNIIVGTQSKNTIFGSLISYGGQNGGTDINSGGNGGGINSIYGGGGGAGASVEVEYWSATSGGTNSIGQNPGQIPANSNNPNYPGSTNGGDSYYQNGIVVPFYESENTTIFCGGGGGPSDEDYGEGTTTANRSNYGTAGCGIGGIFQTTPGNINANTQENSYGGGGGSSWTEIGKIEEQTDGNGGNGVIMFWWSD